MSLSTAQANAGDSSGAAALRSSGFSCKKSVGNTGGWAECTGKATWRIESDCVAQADLRNGWYGQSGGTVRRSAPDCRFSIRKITVETR
ncbi:hypothetical protein AB0933_26345 [Streptomyces venezuelae]|uniref:hypothetical protein n=1 Tax=Streptomyces venezuelae TaxID=54571 RepID=UPI003454C990